MVRRSSLYKRGASASVIEVFKAQEIYKGDTH